MNHILPSLIITPLIGSLILLSINSRKIAYSLAILTSMLMTGLSVLMLIQIYDNNLANIYYELGGWHPSIGIQLVVTQYSAILIILISLSLFVSIIVNYRTIVTTKLYGFLTIISMGFIGMCVTNDIFNMYVFLEITSISTYIILSIDNRNPLAYRSALDYLMIGNIAGIIILLGIALIYSSSGTLNLDLIGVHMSNLSRTSDLSEPNYLATLVVLPSAYLFIVFGLAMKSGLYPLHYWSFRYYINGHSHVIMILMAISTKVMIFTVSKIHHIFDYSQIGSLAIIQNAAQHLIAERLSLIYSFVRICSLFGIIALGLQALRTHRIKTMIALSSLSQICYLLVTISIAQYETSVSFLLQSSSHIIGIVGLLTLYGLIEGDHPGKNITFEELPIMCKNLGISPVVMCILMLGMAGAPFTIGFRGKWYLMLFLYKSHQYFPMCVAIIGNIIALFYTFRIITIFIFATNSSDNHEHTENSYKIEKYIATICATSLIALGLL